MERYRDMAIKKQARIKLLRNIIIFLLLIVVTFWLIFKDQDLGELVRTIKSVDIKYFIIAIIMMFGVYLCESINVRAGLIALGEKKFGIIRALKYTAIGNFFSAITPAATGGQPVEIYYMTKDGIKGANGTMTMLLQLIGFQVATLTYSVIFAVLNTDLLKDGIIWFYLLGLAINGFALIMMLFGTFSNKTAHKLLGLVIKILKRIKVKNLEGKQKKLEEGLKQYSESAKFIKKNKIVFVKAILRVFVQIFIFHSIPYFIYRAFGLNELSFIRLFAMQAILYTTVSGIPLPGSIGVSESLFLKIFGLAFGSTLLSSAMLLYRFASFYLYVIIFAVISFIVATKTKDVIGEVDQNIIDVEKDLYKEKKSSKK